MQPSTFNADYTIDLCCSVADPGGRGGRYAPPPDPVKINHKKDGAEGDCIDFIFLAPLTRLLDPLLLFNLVLYIVNVQ